MRLSVWVPDELVGAVRDGIPGVNVSRVLQEGLRRLLGCKHEAMVCGACAERIDVARIVDDAKSAFYSQMMWELEDLVHAGGTCEGAARVAKGVAVAHQISAANRSLPRPSRAAHKRLNDRRWLEDHHAASA